MSVPSLAGTGNISVKVNALSVTGPSFTYNYQYVVSTFAGTGAVGSTDGSAAAASFWAPVGIAIDGSGNLYITDAYNNKIRRISGGLVSTLAGHTDNSAGSEDGPSTAAGFYFPYGIAMDNSGILYVADELNYSIRSLTSGVVSTLAGSPKQAWGSADGASASALFFHPIGLSLDGKGNLYVADQGNNTIRKIVIKSGRVSTVAGNAANPAGSTDGTGSGARFNNPGGMAANLR